MNGAEAANLKLTHRNFETIYDGKKANRMVGLDIHKYGVTNKIFKKFHIAPNYLNKGCSIWTYLHFKT